MSSRNFYPFIYLSFSKVKRLPQKTYTHGTGEILMHLFAGVKSKDEIFTLFFHGRFLGLNIGQFTVSSLFLKCCQLDVSATS